MSILLKKHSVLSVALIACLTMSACGAKKDVLSPPPPQDSQTEPTVTAETEPTNGSMGGGLPSPYNEDEDSNDGTLPPAPIPTEDPPDYQPVPYPEPSPEPMPEPMPKPEHNPVPAAPVHTGEVSSRPIPGSYVSNDPKSLNKEYPKRYTGGSSAHGLLYTSSSTDDILDFLSRRNSTVNEESRTLNLAAAASVEFAQLNQSGSEGFVTLRIREGRDIKTYNLSGSLGQTSKASEIEAIDFANGYETSGHQEIMGTLKCLDQDGGCNNVFARIKIGTSPKAAIFNVIFRNSHADLFFSLPEKFSDNSEYLQIREMIYNSIKKIDSPNRLASSRINSWEVVHGRSGMTLQMQAYNGEFLGFAGPLLAPESGNEVNIDLSKLNSSPDADSDYSSAGRTRVNYLNSLETVRLVANNGLGQVRIALKMRQRGHYTPELFKITFMRKVEPIIHLSNDNLL